MDKDNFIAYIKTEDIYLGIAKDVPTIFDTLNYELDKPLPKTKNKKVIGLMKDELGGKIMIKFTALRSKAYCYLKDDNNENKKAKAPKKCVVKRKIKFKDYKHCLEATPLESNINHLQKKKNLNMDNLQENYKDFIKDNRLIFRKIIKIL